MKDITLKDLYAGKPDAKDEISFDGHEEFIKTYVVAEHFNIDSLINGSNCFVTGFKGTGKTALLFYLDSIITESAPYSCRSFIFFKEDFTDAKRDELQMISRRILSSITVQTDALLDNKDFEYIWRWLFFKRIVFDNEEYNGQLFENDENWLMFEKIISRIKSPSNLRKSIVPPKIKLALPVKDGNAMTEISPEIEVDFGKQSDDNYKHFLSIIDEAEEYFCKLIKTDIPYYIFVDELEAYYGEINVFKRDLCMIRDLIFTVKRFNTIFSRNEMIGIKVICSVRSEIINAISRFVVTKEINKVISGFSVPLVWNYTNNNSYAHPIMKILIKRISVCCDNESESDLEVYNKWFPEKIQNIEPASYILNNSWCKPRDIVRLISSAQNSIHNNSKSFSQTVFNSISQSYSEDSLSEIKEELRALYDSDQIDVIISCFTGYKTTFSAKQLKERITKYFQGTILDTHFNQILNDLYRLGFLGNFLPVSKTFHWQHKGDGMLILTDEWRLSVHYALHRALSLGSRNDYGLTRGEEPQPGDVAKAIVTGVLQRIALVEFVHYGQEYNGYISLSEFKKIYKMNIRNLYKTVFVGDEFDVVVKEFNGHYENWHLQILTDTIEE